MLQIDNYIHASSLAEAYETLISVPGSVVLGGCGYLRLGARTISTAIDLAKLGLDYINETGTTVEIGAMTSLRSVETNHLCTSLWNGVVPRAVENIVGVQLRNCVTLGGTVAGRFPFSDPIAALLALDTQLHFFHHGQISLDAFLAGKGLKDILEKIIIPKNSQVAAFTSLRKTATDYAILNAAAARTGTNYRVVVGSRPGRAILIPQVASFLADAEITAARAKEAGKIAVEHLQFGDNPRGSAEYRKAICPILIERALMEVMYAA